MFTVGRDCPNKTVNFNHTSDIINLLKFLCHFQNAEEVSVCKLLVFDDLYIQQATKYIHEIPPRTS